MRVPRRRFRVTEKMVSLWARELGVLPDRARALLTGAFAAWLDEQPVYSLDGPELVLSLAPELVLRLKDYVLSLSHPGTRTHRLVTREEVGAEALDVFLQKKGF